MQEYIQQFFEEKNQNNSIFLYGDYGIGKTHLINEILENNKDKNILYFDCRMFELEENSLDIFKEILDKMDDTKNIKEKIINIFKNPESKKRLKRNFIKGTTNFFTWAASKPTNFSIDKKNSKELKKTILKSKIIFVFDELDRISPKTIMKILNNINILMHKMEEENNNDVKIITVGNKKEIESILKTSFGYSNDRFLNKYFEKQISLKDIEKNNFYNLLEKFIKNNDELKNILKKLYENNFFDCWNEKNTRITIRDLKRIIEDYNNFINIEKENQLIGYLLLFKSLKIPKQDIYIHKTIYNNHKIDIGKNLNIYTGNRSVLSENFFLGNTFSIETKEIKNSYFNISNIEKLIYKIFEINIKFNNYKYFLKNKKD